MHSDIIKRKAEPANKFISKAESVAIAEDGSTSSLPIPLQGPVATGKLSTSALLPSSLLVRVRVTVVLLVLVALLASGDSIAADGSSSVRVLIVLTDAAFRLYQGLWKPGVVLLAVTAMV